MAHCRVILPQLWGNITPTTQDRVVLSHLQKILVYLQSRINNFAVQAPYQNFKLDFQS